jgi:hypothetical protein
MISRSAYAAFAASRADIDVHQLAATITRLWVNGLGIRASADRRDG